MQDNVVLQRFRKFKAMVALADMPLNLLMEMLENYITSDNEDGMAVESLPVLDRQLSLFDVS